jgi:hypothetical protein
MRSLMVWFFALALGCSSRPSGPSVATDPGSTAAPDHAPSGDLASTCFTLHLGGTPSPDVALPALIELSREPAPNFVAPGRLAVRQPGAGEPRAPVAWWIPHAGDVIELVLGGGYTGYTFKLKLTGGGKWVGQGTYFADFGVEPAPGPLPLRLAPTQCP